MDFLQGIFIGAIQGITEFLPISSTAHLILVPKFFGWPDLGLKWDTALHFGTALAILAFFAKDWIFIVKSAFAGMAIKENALDARRLTPYPSNILWQIIIASVPAAIAGFLLQDKIESLLYTPKIIFLTLILFGVLIWIIDKLSKKSGELADIKYHQSFFVGVAQTIALIPGVSRSGITMIASRLMGLRRADAARFSFLLSTPAVLGAFILQATKLTASDFTLGFVISILSSAMFGILAIKYLIKYLENNDFTVFAAYRILLAIVVLFALF